MISHSCKTLIDSEPLRIKFDKIDGYIGIDDGTRYLTLFSLSLKSGITNIFSHYFAKCKVGSYYF